MGYSFSVEYKNTAVFGNADGLSQLPTGSGDKQNHCDINVIELVHEEKLDNFTVRTSDIVMEASKDPVLSK